MPKRLIINADDLGYDPAVTRGMLEAMRAGIVSSATLMVNTPSSALAAPLARGLPLGLHLNLARWTPTAKGMPEALLKDGAFVESKVGQLPRKAVELETLSQLARLHALTGRAATHIDVHKHLHRHPAVLAAVMDVATSRSLPVRAVDATMRATLRAGGIQTTDHFVGDAGQEAYWTLPRFLEALAALEEGTTELMCHPGYTPEQVQSGYGAQREVELATFTSAAAREALATSGVMLISFAELSAPGTAAAV